MKNLKKINSILISIVLLLLSIAILIGIKLLFSNAKGFEWGSVTDWISSLSTAGTLCIAFLAYRKAPEWMAQKHYDIAHNIIEDAIYNDLAKVRTSCLHLKFKTVKLCKNLVLALKNRLGEPKSLSESINDIEKDLDALFVLSYSIINRLNSVSRYNYTLTDYAKNISTELQKILNEFNDIHEEILVFSSDIGMLYHADDTVIEVAMTEGRDIQKKVINLNIKTSQFIRDIHSKNRPITDFIRYKKSIS
ncbi:hypothetical protein [Citrobacter portucalensis]|uniref:hypothetical protein n=1 Tax=Citrobacter portucalensis TaxID=1639133 RepID=UPI001ABEE870|nr:hypothetical protein [Citrobacter portucalensis]